MDIKNARKIIGKKIIGVTCHNSIKLAKAAIKENADYIAFGAFFSTKTKKVIFKADIKILNKIKKLTKIPIVAIGGISGSEVNLAIETSHKLAKDKIYSKVISMPCQDLFDEQSNSYFISFEQPATPTTSPLF